MSRTHAHVYMCGHHVTCDRAYVPPGIFIAVIDLKGLHTRAAAVSLSHATRAMTRVVLVHDCTHVFSSMMIEKGR